MAAATDLRSLLAMWRPGNELEAALVSPPARMTRDQFSAALARATQAGKNCQEHDEVLDVSLADGRAGNERTRVSVRGLQAICAYHKRAQLSAAGDVAAQGKARIGHAFAGPFKVRLATERPVELSTSLRAAFDGPAAPKLFRLKKRFSVLLPSAEAPCYRADCTIVRASLGSTPAKAVPEAESYEVELEHVGPSPPREDELLGWLRRLAADADGQPAAEEEPEGDPVRQYLALVAAHLGPGGAAPTVEQAAQRPKRWFAGPNLVTLGRRHLLPADGDAAATVLHGYAVTEKADGDRTLLYVAPGGRSYTLNNQLQAERTGLPDAPDLAGTLLDCELVRLRGESGRRAALVFDAYFHRGECVADRPLLARAELYDRAVQRLRAEGAAAAALDVRAKAHRPFNLRTMAREVQACLDACATRDYGTDGLIFTPVDLAVGSAPTAADRRRPTLGGTWERVLKWKPPQCCTIDFHVRLRPAAGAGAQEAQLLVGTAACTPEHYYPRRHGAAAAASYFLAPFPPAPVTALPSPPACEGEGGEVVLDDQVVEMRYDPGPPGRWVPVRVRHDKTAVHARSGGREVAANSLQNALAVWESVRYPVTEAHITGRVRVQPADVPPPAGAATDKKRYYARTVDRSRSALQGMLAFHNLWIKEHTLLRPARLAAGPSLVDLGCGKAGDLAKWLRCGYATVLGLDSVEDNLVNAADGAYRRLAEHPQHRRLRAAFLPLDLSKPALRQVEALPQGAYASDLARAVYGLGPVRRELAHVAGMGQGRCFDVASCQFALHYFFRSRAALSAFLDNLLLHLRPGGLFVGTTFDGDAVARLLEADGAGGRAGSASGGAWSIHKKYDGRYDPAAFGQRVGVYVQTINQHIDEYLVGFELLERQLGARGLRPLTAEECLRAGLPASTGTFAEAFAAMQQQSQSQQRGKPQPQPQSLQQALAMTDDEKAFSFLSRWFVFKRDEAQAM